MFFNDKKKIIFFIKSKQSSFSYFNEICINEFNDKATQYERYNIIKLLGNNLDNIMIYGWNFDKLTIDHMLGKLFTLLFLTESNNPFMEIVKKYFDYMVEKLDEYKNEKKYFIQLSIYILIYLYNSFSFSNIKYNELLNELETYNLILCDIIMEILYENNIEKIYKKNIIQLNEYFKSSISFSIKLYNENKISVNKNEHFLIEKHVFRSFLLEYPEVYKNIDDENNIINKLLNINFVSDLETKTNNYITINRLLFPKMWNENNLLSNSENDEYKEHKFLEAMYNFYCEHQIDEEKVT